MSWTVCSHGIQVWWTGWGLKRAVQKQKDEVTDREREWALNRPKPSWLTEEGWAEFKLALDRK